MGTPQTPDSMKKSQREQTPPPEKRDAERPETPSNTGEGDTARKRQGGI